jgi:hypothetical protein
MYRRANPQQGRAAMNKQDHRKIAADCAIAAAVTISLGDRQQLLQIQKKHLELAEKEEAQRETGEKLMRELKTG